jgi:uncharacterized protein (DUF983 family)
MSTTDSFKCSQCGHRYGADSSFVKTTHCCPKCGENVDQAGRSRVPYFRMAVAVIIGVIMVVIVMTAQTIFQV